MIDTPQPEEVAPTDNVSPDKPWQPLGATSVLVFSASDTSTLPTTGEEAMNKENPSSSSVVLPEPDAPTDNAPAVAKAEDLRPHVLRMAFAGLETPLVQVTLSYLVREGHEDEDTAHLDAVTNRAKLLGGLYHIRESILKRPQTDGEQIAGIYDALPSQEQERLLYFAMDAQARVDNPEQQKRFVILDAFQSFLWEDAHATPAQVMEWLGLSQGQCDRYREAWRILQGVHAETQQGSLGTQEGATGNATE